MIAINNIFSDFHTAIRRTVIYQNTLDIKTFGFLSDDRFQASTYIALDIIDRYYYGYLHKIFYVAIILSVRLMASSKG